MKNKTMKNKQLIKDTIFLIESATKRKVVLKENYQQLANDIFGEISTSRNWENKAKQIISQKGLNSSDAQIVMELLAGVDYFGEDLNEAPMSISMTSKQLERNPQEVERVAKKGFDIKLTDLKEEELNEEFSPFPEEQPQDCNMFDVDILQSLENEVLNQELLLDDEENTQILESNNQTKLETANSDVEKMLRKMFDDNGGDWKKVSTSLQGTYQKIKDSNVSKQNEPIKAKF